MRYCKYLAIILLVFIGHQVCAQSSHETDITGLWKGVLYNDSTSQSYRYEIGISEDNGKLSGFSHTWYNEKDYFVIKKLKIKKSDGKIIIEDVDIIAYNYPEPPPKGVRRLHVLTLEEKDSILILSGVFSTSRTKKYTAATGTVTLQRNNDHSQSALIPSLKKLGLEKKLSFLPVEDEVVKKEEDRTLVKSSIAINTIHEEKKTAKQKQLMVPPPVIVKIKPVAVSKINNEVKAPAAEVSERKNIIQETMYFKSDSLQLSLFDNGEVDGDTVSVLLNGKIIMERQRLSTNAIRKTVFIDPSTDSIQLLMYAENLGSIPPNTGLLIVRDGKDNYEIRFSGDLQKNAAIILKRRKN